MSFEYYSSATGTVVANGVFIPATALVGVQSAELATGEVEHLKFSKSVSGMLEKIFSILAPANFAKLGFTVSKATNTSGVDRITNVFGLTFQKVVNERTNAVAQIPVPTAGVNNGIGDFSLVDIFPSAVKLNAGAQPPAAGILIPTALVTDYSSITHADLTVSGSSDNRDWLAGFMHWLGSSVSLRSASTPSAVTARAVSSASTSAIPTQFTALTDPVSGLSANDVPVLSLIQRSVSVSLEMQLDPSNQTFDVRSVTA